MNFQKYFTSKVKSSQAKTYSDQERLDLFNIDNTEEQRLRSLIFEISNYEKDDQVALYYLLMDMSNLVGLNRPEPVNNWIECLYGLRRQKNFNEFTDRTKFESFLLSCDEHYPDLPVVIEDEGKYYIDSGKHRLTMAMCLGIRVVPVLVAASVGT